MCKEFFSNSRRKFLLKSVNGKTVLIHDRECEKNENDIAACSVLALHKAIIGVCELFFLESASEKLGNRFRPSIAVQTYYIVYHLFCSCMLLDNDYDLIYRIVNNKECQDLVEEYEKNSKWLNDDREIPKVWNKCKWNEIDIATSITHENIKKYCKDFRDNNRYNNCHGFLRVLYLNFIKELPNSRMSIKGLYEKLDYIRDRSIYRPTLVVQNNKDFNYAQTSNDVRKEIDGLPTSNDLYSVVSEIVSEIFKNNSNRMLNKFIESFYFDTMPVDCNEDHLHMFGYDWEDVIKLGGNKEFEYVPMFVYQLIELFSYEDTKLVYEKYWKPLFETIRAFWKE